MHIDMMSGGLILRYYFNMAKRLLQKILFSLLCRQDKDTRLKTLVCLFVRCCLFVCLFVCL